MELKEIQELIDFISRSEFSTFEMENEGFRIKLIRSRGGEMVVSATGPGPHGGEGLPVFPASGNGAVPMVALSAPSPAPAPAASYHEIKSPIVGTFFRSPNPQASAFVETGSRVKAGQPLCIVEAMKLMNEIECDIEGEVVEILVANGQPVEYGEILFRIRPVAA